MKLKGKMVFRERTNETGYVLSQTDLACSILWADGTSSITRKEKLRPLTLDEIRHHLIESVYRPGASADLSLKLIRRALRESLREQSRNEEVLK